MQYRKERVGGKKGLGDGEGRGMGRGSFDIMEG